MAFNQFQQYMRGMQGSPQVMGPAVQPNVGSFAPNRFGMGCAVQGGGQAMQQFNPQGQFSPQGHFPQGLQRGESGFRPAVQGFDPTMSAAQGGISGSAGALSGVMNGQFPQLNRGQTTQPYQP